MDEPTTLKHGWPLRLLYPVIRVVVIAVFLILGPIRTKRREQVPKSGGLLIVANHRADIDPIAIQIGSPRLIHFMAKSDLFPVPILGGILRFFGAFPVRRGEPDRAALRRAAELVRIGEVVCLFPEGQLTETGKLQPLLPGAALIARQSGGQVICCGLRNTERVMPYGKVIPRPGWKCIHVVWGSPRTLSKDDEADGILDWMRSELLQLSGEAQT